MSTELDLDDVAAQSPLAMRELADLRAALAQSEAGAAPKGWALEYGEGGFSDDRWVCVRHLEGQCGQDFYESRDRLMFNFLSALAASQQEAQPEPKQAPQVGETWHILRAGATACATVKIAEISDSTALFEPDTYGVPGERLPLHNGMKFIERAQPAAQPAPEHGTRTGWPPGMLQDDSRELSRALAGKPDAMRHAREAAGEISQPTRAEPMTRDQAVQIARTAARFTSEKHNYLPRTLAEPFEPHAWVVDAILTAARSAQPTRERLSDMQISDAYIKWDKTPGTSLADFARAIERLVRGEGAV